MSQLLQLESEYKAKMLECKLIQDKIRMLKNEERIALRDNPIVTPLKIKVLDDLIKSYLYCSNCESLAIGDSCLCDNTWTHKEWITYGAAVVVNRRYIVFTDPRDYVPLSILWHRVFYDPAKNTATISKNKYKDYKHYCYSCDIDFDPMTNLEEHKMCNHCKYFTIFKVLEPYTTIQGIIPAGALLRIGMANYEMFISRIDYLMRE